jgi:hypothetical protein
LVYLGLKEKWLTSHIEIIFQHWTTNNWGKLNYALTKTNTESKPILSKIYNPNLRNSMIEQYLDGGK